jgi:hypothetical protein
VRGLRAAVRWIRALKLPAGDKLTLLVLATYADRDNANAFPGVARLATESECSVREVQRRLDRLRRRGLVEVQAPARQHRPTTYRVVVPTVRGDRDVTPAHTSGVTSTSPLERSGVTSETVRGDLDVAPEVTCKSPDQYRDQGTDQKSKAAAAPQFSRQAREPNATGNYYVIVRLAADLLRQQPFTSEGDLVEATKWACAQNGIDYGSEVDTRVVHRACASAWMTAQRSGGQRSTSRTHRRGPPPLPPGKYSGPQVLDEVAEKYAGLYVSDDHDDPE